MKKVVVMMMSVAMMATAFLPGATAFAAEDARLNEQEVSAVVQELTAEGYLELTETGVEVTEKYVETVQANLGDQYTVYAEGNAIKVVETHQMMQRGLMGGGETKIEYNENSVDLYLSGTICFMLKSGADIASFLASLIPVPVLDVVVVKIIEMTSNLILGKDKGNGVILSIKLIKGTYIPYFVTVSSQAV